MKQIILFFALAAAHLAHGADTKPNILFLIADDLSWHSTGFAGDPVVKTPNLDRIAADGDRKSVV